MFNWEEVLTDALLAGEEAYRIEYKRIGSKDAGTCGCAYVDVPNAHPLAKYALKTERCFRDGFAHGYRTLILTHPLGVPFVQSINVHKARAEAVLAALKTAGIERARLRAFVD